MAARRRITTVAIAVLVVMFAAGCTGRSAGGTAAGRVPSQPAAPPSSSAAPSASPSTPAPSPSAAAPTATAGKVAWTYTEQRPIGTFEKVDGVLVGLTLRDKLLRITALQPQHGTVLWDKPASPGYTPGGVSPTFTIVGKNVVYLSPYSAKYHYWTRVSVVAAKTGHTVSESADLFEIDGMPTVCGSSICFQGARDHDNKVSGEQDWVMNPRTGSVAAANGTSAPVTQQNWRVIGNDGLIEIGDGAEVGRQVKGKLLWHRRWDTIFPQDFSANGGWQWTYDGAHHLFVGQVGWYPPGGKVTKPYAIADKSIMVALDSRTGKLRWRENGVSIQCPPVTILTELTSTADLSYRCRYRSGTVDLTKGAKVFKKDLGITLERYNRLTGRATWSVDIDPYSIAKNGADQRLIRLLDHDHLLLRQQHRVVAVDTATGKVTPAAAATPGWCITAEVDAYANEPWQGAGRGRVSEDLADQCDSHGTTTKITTLPPTGIATVLGSLHVVTGQHAVTAVRAG